MTPSPPAVTIVFLGILLAGLGILAHALGFDPNPSWGMGRVILTISGAITILMGLLYDRFMRHWVELVTSKLATRPHEGSQKIRDRYLLIISCTMMLLSGLVYTWVTTAGTWTRWDSYTYYYDDLAAGFQQGHLHLATEPSDELLALPDPYNPATRAGVNYFIDASFYKGKYYLYWGPVPSLMLLLPKRMTGEAIGDLFLLYFFAIGTLIFKYALLSSIFRRFFDELPLWLFATGLLVAGLVGHHAWTLNSPRIYEAATTGGGFFFIAGYYFAYRALEKNFHHTDLMLAGTMWACAIGTRMTQALSVASVIILMVVYYATRKNSPGMSGALIPALAVGVPLTLAFLGLAWYNLVRFDSISEFGLYYMLVAGVDLRSFYDLLFSVQYIPQNIYNYLFAPFTLQPKFPFFATERGLKEAVFPFYAVPSEYFTERITGLFRSSPILITAFLPPLFLTVERWRRPRAISTHMESGTGPLFQWMTISLTASSVMGFLPVAAYFWAGNRFLADFLSPLSVLAVAGLWLGYSMLAKNRYVSPFLFIGIFAVTSFSIIVNLLLLNEVERIHTLNPDLYRQLTAFKLFIK